MINVFIFQLTIKNKSHVSKLSLLSIVKKSLKSL
ncbi:hypothetical protein BOVA604_2927 [Bacteroides ovatus]|jgi:hypothetical protein|nr:hypothetical protein BOVA604_2927 [Bacteroides ovatus]